MIAPPPPQIQVQFPMIDELADEFALLIVNVKRELRSLSGSQLQDVKELVEEKLKSKGAPITIPSSADELISTISKYWNFLSFEFAWLVVRHLGKKDLHTQLKSYEEKLQKKDKILLTHCREKNITPRAPPGCFRMKITVDEDPYSFSLHRILEFKDFLVHRMGMDIALFAGFQLGSIILHFCILEDDMETSVHQLYVHKLELRAMQVVAIEVHDVIVYHNAPIERPPSIAAVSRKIDDLPVAMETGGPIVSKNDLCIDVTNVFGRDSKVVKEMVVFGKEVTNISQNVLQAVKEAGHKEIQAIYQVKDALHHLMSVVEAAYQFLDKVDDIFYYCQNDSMKDAIQELSCSPPDLNPLRDLLSLSGNSLKMAESKYSELVEVCDIAKECCREAEELCARKETDSQNKKGVTKGVGGIVAGMTLAGRTAAAAGGIAVLAVAGAFAFGMLPC